ncbi:MAG: hypothetical protein WA191_17585 [Telluria sp.]|nr:hypothetical protein [Telluria sp.]
MNSIDEDKVAAPLAALFDEMLLPIAQRMRAQNVLAFPMEPDVSWLSYYVRRKHSQMTSADFISSSCSDIAEFEQKLAQHWQALGRHELAAKVALAGRAATAARASQAERGADAAELSPYVYAMF